MKRPHAGEFFVTAQRILSAAGVCFHWRRDDAARARLLADAPVEVRSRFEQRIDVRLKAETGSPDGR